MLCPWVRPAARCDRAVTDCNSHRRRVVPLSCELPAARTFEPSRFSYCSLPCFSCGAGDLNAFYLSLAGRPVNQVIFRLSPLRNELSSTVLFRRNLVVATTPARSRKDSTRMNPLSPTQLPIPRVLTGLLSYGKQYTSKSSGMCRNIHSY